MKKENHPLIKKNKLMKHILFEKLQKLVEKSLMCDYITLKDLHHDFLVSEVKLEKVFADTVKLLTNHIKPGDNDIPVRIPVDSNPYPPVKEGKNPFYCLCCEGPEFF